MTSRFSDWLASLGRAGTRLPAHPRGEAFELIVNFDADLSASTFTGSVAAFPGATAIADFTVSEGTWDGEVFPVTFTLADSVSYPGDEDGDFLAEAVFQVEKDGEFYLGGVLPIRGAV